jgi:hypothetical protein
MAVPEQFDFRIGISIESAAFKLIDILLKFVSKKYMLVEYFVI